MRIVVTRDQHQFAEHASGFLAEAIERNVLATVLMNVLSGRFAGTGPLFAYGLAERDQISFAALRVPPYPMMCTDLDPSLADELIGLWLQADPELDGVSGPTGPAQALAGAWSRLTGGPTRCNMREALHALTRVEGPARPARGRLRAPLAREHELLLDWSVQFTSEAGVIGGEQARASTRAQLARKALWVWDDGEPVSMIGTAQRVADVVRIGPVYTPSAHRRRGYAGSAVAAVCRRALADGVRECALFTDLANPTSNKIYAEIGFRRVVEWEDWALGG